MNEELLFLFFFFVFWHAIAPFMWWALLKCRLTLGIDTNVLCHVVGIHASHWWKFYETGCNVTPRVRLIFQRKNLIGKEHNLTSSELKQRSATFLEGIFLALGPHVLCVLWLWGGDKSYELKRVNLVEFCHP